MTMMAFKMRESWWKIGKRERMMEGVQGEIAFHYRRGNGSLFLALSLMSCRWSQLGVGNGSALGKDDKTWFRYYINLYLIPFSPHILLLLLSVNILTILTLITSFALVRIRSDSGWQ